MLEVSGRWLQSYVNKKYQDIPQEVNIQSKPILRLTLQMDELWSFVDNKANKQWVWLALDIETREIVGCFIGDRSSVSAEKLWQSLHPVNVMNHYFSLHPFLFRTTYKLSILSRGINNSSTSAR